MFRNFKFEPQQAQETSQEEAELSQEQKRLTVQVSMYIKSNFSEVIDPHLPMWRSNSTACRQMFVAFMHLKAIRVFVESVLWYSLPPNFQVMLIQVRPSVSAFSCIPLTCLCCTA